MFQQGFKIHANSSTSKLQGITDKDEEEMDKEDARQQMEACIPKIV